MLAPPRALWYWLASWLVCVTVRVATEMKRFIVCKQSVCATATLRTAFALRRPS